MPTYDSRLQEARLVDVGAGKGVGEAVMSARGLHVGSS